jgi:hypothetical protein
LAVRLRRSNCTNPEVSAAEVDALLDVLERLDALER